MYLAIRPPVKEKLFCGFGGHILTGNQFTEVLNEVLSTIGLAGKNYKAHSLRIGAATSAAMFGIFCKAGG
jgi:hypothetical protein